MVVTPVAEKSPAMATELKVGPVILLGPPGAGKGTQAKQITARYGVPHISTGDILRENRQRGTDLGKKASAVMDRGELVPDQLVNDMVADRLRQADCARGFILDGYPRTVAQAEWLDNFLKDCAADAAKAVLPPVVIKLNVDYNQVLRRLGGRRSCPTCGRIYNVYLQPPRVADTCDVEGSRLVARSDDSEAVISERLKAYDRQTLPLAEYYRKSGRLREVNGDQPVERVTAEMFKAIEHDRL